MESRRDFGMEAPRGKASQGEGRDSGKRKEPPASSSPCALQLPIHKPRFLGRAVSRPFPEPKIRVACSSPGNRIHMLGGGGLKNLLPSISLSWSPPPPICFLPPCVPYELTGGTPHSLRHPHLNSTPGSFA